MIAWQILRLVLDQILHQTLCRAGRQTRPETLPGMLAEVCQGTLSKDA